ncbi:hypothetical protein M8C21_004336 [Ambrosia artemisiifolia]|uniref:Leucine-rich repeat-containing N-terminal plant-type domain-containing protein n=1 Tax=Ambrosia artemisiifolia TaxID=4212 RepID=A0AAD5G9H6_AMBAR|nr:hypothetical protein M8C21_004336 [Ambrosia artemisiifolia]
MDRIPSLFSFSTLLLFILVLYKVSSAYGNAEGDALYALKIQLSDPNNVLQSWDPTLINPCSWNQVTCNNNNSVTRVINPSFCKVGIFPNRIHVNGFMLLATMRVVLLECKHMVIDPDLTNANLSGRLIPELGQLTNLEYLELYCNNISGKIPTELGELKNLVSLELYSNRLEGNIPDTLGNLKKLRFLYDFTSFRFSFNEISH